MENFIDAKCAILNIMQVHERARLSVIKSFAELFSKRVPNSYVDISWNAVASFFEDYSEYVIKKDDVIMRTSSYGRFADRKFLDDTINRKFSKEVRQAIKEASELTDPAISQNDKTKIDIGIIGFGNFGKLMAKHLSTKADVIVADTEDKTKEAEEIGVKFVDLEEVLERKIIILSMPMRSLTPVLHEIKDSLNPGTLVIDVCSLKMFSREAMISILPKDVDIVGTHPLFGPQTATDSLKDLRIVVCDIRIKDISPIVSFLESFGLKVFLKTPEEHDRQMADSQALTHFIGTIIRDMGIKRVELGTKTFDKLMDVLEVVQNNTPALFEDMQTLNPFAGHMRDEFIFTTEELHERLVNKEVE